MTIEISTDKELLDTAVIHRYLAEDSQDAHGLYAQYGFTAPANPERQMELPRPQALASTPP